MEESRILLANNLWTGSYYMEGLAIECALKSCLAGAVKEHDFPDKDFVLAMYVHNLEKLFKLNGALWDELQESMRSDSQLRLNWKTVRDWDDGKRYDIVSELEAAAFYSATSEAWHGIMEWIRRRW